MLEYYIIAAITFISAGLGLIFAIAECKKAGEKEKLNAIYNLARSAALVFLTVIPLIERSFEILIAVTAAMLIVQIIDGVAGMYVKRFSRVWGPFFMAFTHAICIFLLII